MQSCPTDFCAGGALPLSLYPRPQMQRDTWTCLNGAYDYAITSTNEKPNAWEGKILVPFAPESALSGVKRPVLPGQTLWYRRVFNAENLDFALHTILHFGAVDHSCTIWVNGNKAGTHTGGFCPFSFDITPLLIPEENELLIAVQDNTDQGDAPRGKQVLQPKGIWYTAVTGIWQTVWLEQVNESHISAVRLTPELDRITIAPVCTGSGTITVDIFDGDDFIYTTQFSAGSEDTIVFESPKLWTPETPFLYGMTVSLTCGGKTVDMIKSYFGLRTFGVGADEKGVTRLLLNGKPYFQKGLLDQGYWPDGLYTAPTDEALCADIRAAKRMGFNMLRKHIKIEPARWYYHCDRLGMLVWQDMPNGGAYPGNLAAVGLPNLGVHLKDTNYARFKRQAAHGRALFHAELCDMVSTLRDTVCICTWVPFNEGWGQFDAAKVAAWLKTLDPTRLVDHASGWHDQKAGDMISVHKYILPVKAPRHEMRRAFVLSEYGGYSRIVEGHVWNKKKSFGYRMYNSRQALTSAYQKLHETQILPLIAKGLSAVVYTQLSDVECEVNGLFTYDRAVCKLDETIVRQINQMMVV